MKKPRDASKDKKKCENKSSNKTDCHLWTRYIGNFSHVTENSTITRCRECHVEIRGFYRITTMSMGHDTWELHLKIITNQTIDEEYRTIRWQAICEYWKMLEQLDAAAAAGAAPRRTVQSTLTQMSLERQGSETVVTGFCTLHGYIILAVSIFF